jgi:hypothetical protein
MVDGLRILLRRIDPGFERFKNEDAVLVDETRTGYIRVTHDGLWRLHAEAHSRRFPVKMHSQQFEHQTGGGSGGGGDGTVQAETIAGEEDRYGQQGGNRVGLALLEYAGRPPKSARRLGDHLKTGHTLSVQNRPTG